MKKTSWVYLFLIALPIIDLFSSLTTRIFPNAMTIGMIVKGFTIILSFVYVFFLSTSKYKKVSKYYYLLLLLYIFFYFIFKSDLLSFNYIGSELKYIFKFSYFPVMFFSLLNYYDENGFDKKTISKVFFISICIYIVLIILPTLLDLNFKSYLNTNYYGSIGWFYSANEISTILLLLYPIIYSKIYDNKLLVVILFILSLYMISLIGTKVTLFGIIIISFLEIILISFKSKKIVSINNGLVILMFIITVVFMFNNYSTLNLKSSLSEIEVNEIVKIENELNEYYQNDSTFIKLKEIGSKLLSDRDVFALNTLHIFKINYRYDYLWFGMGYSSTLRVESYSVEKLIEIDFLDIFFHMGIMALLIIIFPYVYILKILISKLKKKEISFSVDIFFYIMMLLLTIGISSTAGHVYMAPAVSIYIDLYLIILASELNMFRKKQIKKNKIVILALHMNFGGVENAIATKASMLAKDFDVEIISLYKGYNKIPFSINKKVTINYLMNDISNRQDFLNYLKKGRLFKSFKEGIKALKILANKNKLMKEYILNSDANVIISTRYSFSKLLNKYGNKDAIKIHEQHVYDVSNNYITKLNNLNNINYIMPVSNSLYQEYYKSLREKDKLKYIPLSLNYYPGDTETANLNNKNLISVGRLDRIKGYDDLIRVMNLVIKKDKDIKLNLFGDGQEKENLIKLINDLKLEKNIKLWGFKTPEFISKYYQNSTLYVMTSFEESFGLVVIEAASYGLPCIIFDSAKGPLDVINDNNGFIIKNRNLNEMADTILDYINSNYKNKFGTNARKSIEKYRFENIQKEWLKFLKKVI